MKKEKVETKKSTDLKFIIAVIIIIILLGLIIWITFIKVNTSNNEPKKEEPKIKYNTNENVVKDKEVNGILFTNIKCSFDGEYSIINYTIVNNTKETINLKEYEVIIKDKDGTIIAIISPNLDENIEPGKTRDTGNAINIDLTKAYSMELNLEPNNNAS